MECKRFQVLYKDWFHKTAPLTVLLYLPNPLPDRNHSELLFGLLCSLCVPSQNDSMHNTLISLHIMHTMRRRAGETFSPGIRLISIVYGCGCLGGILNGVQGVGSLPLRGALKIANLLIPTSIIERD
jgi:hypothetical protein